MNIVSTSPLTYFQKKGMGRRNARDYRMLHREDPFRNGQVTFQPRLGWKLNTVERMISRPCETQERLRNMY